MSHSTAGHCAVVLTAEERELDGMRLAADADATAAV